MSSCVYNRASPSNLGEGFLRKRRSGECRRRGYHNCVYSACITLLRAAYSLIPLTNLRPTRPPARLPQEKTDVQKNPLRVERLTVAVREQPHGSGGQPVREPQL